MKKKDTVKSQKEFTEIIQTKKRINSNYFVIYYRKNILKHSRYGISVGTKLGNAVFRNSYKRKIRMIIHENPDLYEKCYDYIILLRKNGIDKNYNELKKDFNQIAKKLKEI